MIAAVVVAVVAFVAAYALGHSSTKKTNPPPVSTQLQSPSSVQGPPQVQITAVGSAAAVPGLKPKPAPPKPKVSQTATTQAPSTPSTSPGTSTVQSTTPTHVVIPQTHVTPAPKGSNGSSSSGSNGSSSTGSHSTSSGSS